MGDWDNFFGEEDIPDYSYRAHLNQLLEDLGEQQDNLADPALLVYKVVLARLHILAFTTSYKERFDVVEEMSGGQFSALIDFISKMAKIERDEERSVNKITADLPK